MKEERKKLYQNQINFSSVQVDLGKISQVRSNQVTPSHFRSGHVRSSQVKPSQIRSGQVMLNQVKSSQASQSKMKRSGVRWSRLNWTEQKIERFITKNFIGELHPRTYRVTFVPSLLRLQLVLLHYSANETRLVFSLEKLYLNSTNF